MVQSKKIGLAVWQDDVATVLDFARTLLSVEIEAGHQKSRSTVSLPDGSVSAMADQLIKSGIDVLLCGAISRPLAIMLDLSGIDVVSDVSGSVEAVLEAYSAGCLDQQQFMMPGCQLRRGGGSGCRHGARRRHRTKKGHSQQT